MVVRQPIPVINNFLAEKCFVKLISSRELFCGLQQYLISVLIFMLFFLGR